MRTAILIALVAVLSFVPAAHAIDVKPGESIQQAIDGAPDGAVINLAPGLFAERITITKPITLIGAGWDKTTLKPDKPAGFTQQEKDDFFKRLEATSDAEQRTKIAMEIAGLGERPTITIRSAKGVKIENLKVQGRATGNPDQGISAETLIEFDHATGSMTGCAVVGPFMNGVAVVNDSDVQISKSLVAAIWGTGVRVGSNAKLNLSDSELRNCYHRCVTINSEGSTIENCNISGSAWHGIRYDHVSPTIINNRIFANARSGIYASGKTAATVRDNVFFKNEMDGISCWFQNQDRIESNKFVENLREGISVVGGAKPTLSKNIFIKHPVAVIIGQVSGHEEVGDPTLAANIFWENQSDVKRMDKDVPLDNGNIAIDPKLADVTPKSDWPVQPEEKAIIPDSDTRDCDQWKKVAERQEPAKAGKAG